MSWCKMAVTSPGEQVLDLGGGIMLEMVLIPAGTNQATQPPRAPHDERPAGQRAIAASAVILLATVLILAQRWRRRRTKPQFSLRLIMFVTLAVALGAFGYSKFAASQRTLDAYRKKHPFVPPDTFPLLVQGLPFLIGKFEITVEQYEQITGQRLAGARNEPASNITWQDANSFCRALSSKLGREFRLPWEREWEYACRAGTRTNFSSGNSPADLGRTAWFLGNSSGRLHAVGLKAPNAFGVYDMHGNVSEWVLNGQHRNEDEPAPFWMHGIRGGSYCCGAMFCESRQRYLHRDDFPSQDIGFRVITYALSADDVSHRPSVEASDKRTTE